MGDQSRLLLAAGVGLPQVSAAAQRAGWTRVFEDPRDGHRPHRVAWTGSGWPPDVRVYYIDDHLIHVAYLLVRGAERERAMATVQLLVPAYGMERAAREALAARTPAEKITAIRGIAVLAAAGDVHRGALSIFDAGFIDPDPEVRRTTIGASTYPAWREFESRLEIMIAHDNDESVRDLARRAITALREHDWHA